MSAQLTSLHLRQTGFILIGVGLAGAAAMTVPDVYRLTMNGQVSATLVTAICVAILDRFPICLDPTGELPLISVIVIPTLVLFGWPAAVLGATIGLATGLLSRPSRNTLIRLTEEVAAIAAAAIGLAIPLAGTGRVGAVILASLVYIVVRTLLASVRLEREEAIALARAARFLIAGTLLHLLVFTAFAAIAVWSVSNNPSLSDRLLVPVLAAAVTLQLYLPRIQRGQERRRVLAAVSVLAAVVDAKDPYTAGHSVEVARLCQRVARILGLNEPEVHHVYLAALLHDVGKMAVPATVLLKPGKLTDEEWQVMRSHVEAGVRIVESIGGLAEIAPIVAASHEQLDGGGYPRGLKGDGIPLGSRINLVVDAYNALTTDRPYRAARSPEAAFREMEAHAGTQLDPRVVAALRIALGYPRVREAPARTPAWLTLLRQPAFALLWGGELVGFFGDNLFFIAVTLWIIELTKSATVLAFTLVAATVGQGLTGFFAGVLADRVDRRGLIVATDVSRAAIVAILPFLFIRSLPISLLLLVVLNMGTVLFRTAAYALIPSFLSQPRVPTANAMFQTTERIAEVLGGILGAAIVIAVGYRIALYLNALCFLISAACVGLMPVRWGAGLGAAAPRRVFTEIGEGLRFIWHTPIHRVLALLIVPGYLTLAFNTLQTPMVIQTAGLSMIAYGWINSALGAGKLVSAVVLSGSGKWWTRVSFVVVMYVVTAIATVLFGATKFYPVLIAAAFLFGVGNVATIVGNTTISVTNAPSEILGRLLASRQVFIAATTVVGLLVFGHVADRDGPQLALALLGLISGCGVVITWLLAGRQRFREIPVQAPGGAAD